MANKMMFSLKKTKYFQFAISTLQTTKKV